MSETMESYTVEFVGLVRQAIRFKHRFRAVLPEEMATAQARIKAALPESAFVEAADYDLLYRLAVLLASDDSPMTMTELGQAAEVPLSTATRLVDMLVEHAYAERLSDPNDRRVVRVRLSPTGSELYRTIDQLIQHRIALILRRFSAEECETLLRLLHKALDGLIEQST